MNTHISKLVYSVIVLSILALPCSVMAQPFLYIPNSGESTVSVIDAATQTEVTKITVGSFPRAVALNQTKTRVYVANSGDDSISVIDTATNTVVTTIQLVIGGSDPYSLVVHPDGTRLYVANRFGGGKVAVIDTETNTFIESVDVGSSGLWDIAIHPSGKYLFVTNSSADTLSVIETATNTAIQTVDTGDSPLGVSVHPNGKAVFVANAFDNTISEFKLIDTSLSQSRVAPFQDSAVASSDISRPINGGGALPLEVPATITETGQFPTDVIPFSSGEPIIVPEFNANGFRIFPGAPSAPHLPGSTPPLFVPTGYGSEGGFFAVIGDEVVTPPDKFFYSHAYSLNYTEPFTHTGVVAGYIQTGTEPVGWGNPPVVGTFAVPQFQGGPNFASLGDTEGNFAAIMAEGDRILLNQDLQRMENAGNPGARSLAANGAGVQFRFFYRAGYGTPAYDGNPWVVAQDFSDLNTATIDFPAEDKYVVVINGVSDPDNIPADVPILGMSVDLGAGDEDVQVTGITANLPGGTPRAGDFVTFIVNATGPESISYRFFYRAGYGTPAYNTNPWVNFRNFSTNNAATVAFPDAAHYVVVVHAVEDPSNIPTALPIIGMHMNVGEAS